MKKLMKMLERKRDIIELFQVKKDDRKCNVGVALNVTQQR